MDDPYKILGVSPDASDDEIKRAYRALAKKYHPDRNPGDPVAAKKMQQINDAYAQIKNPDAYRRSDGGSGWNPYGSYQGSGDAGQYRSAAYQYICFGRYQEALHILENDNRRDAQWYYLSALANDGLGNQVTALEHIRRAVSMDPGNAEYLDILRQIENGGVVYRRQAGAYRGFSMGKGSLWELCMCFFAQMFCCRGRFFCC